MPDPTQPGQPTTPGAPAPPATFEDNQEDTFEFTYNNGKKYNIPKVIGETPVQAILGNMISRHHKDTSKIAKLERQVAELSGLKGDYETTATRLQELEDSGLSEKDREIVGLKRQLNDLAKKQQAADESAKVNFEKFKAERITTDIMGAVGTIDVYNPKQTAALFMSEAQVELMEDKDAGTHKTHVTMTLPDQKGIFETVTGSPTEVFKRWIALEGNAYLLRNNLTPGGGSTKGGAQGGSGSLTFTKSQIAKDPEARKRLNAAVAEGKADQIRVIED